MSYRDGETHNCADALPHKQHTWTTFDGAHVICNGVSTNRVCEFKHPHPAHQYVPVSGGEFQCPGIWPATVALPGSISHGTLRCEDLLSTFGYVLTHVNPAEAAIIGAWYSQQPGDEEDREEYLLRLTTALEESAPEGYYFGAIEGDGSDFGFWELGCEICGTTTRNDEGELIDHTEDECFK